MPGKYLTALFMVLPLVACKPESSFTVEIPKRKVPLKIVIPVVYEGYSKVSAEEIGKSENYQLFANCAQRSRNLFEAPAEDNAETSQGASGEKQLQKTDASDDASEGDPVGSFPVMYHNNDIRKGDNGKIKQLAYLFPPPLQKGTDYCLRIKPMDTVDDNYVEGTEFHFKTMGRLKPDETGFEASFGQPHQLILKFPARFDPAEHWEKANINPSYGSTTSQTDDADTEENTNPAVTNTDPKATVPRANVNISSLASPSFPPVLIFQDQNGQPVAVDPSVLLSAIKICPISLSQDKDGFITTANNQPCKSNTISGFTISILEDFPSITAEEPEASHPTLYGSNFSMFTVTGDVFTPGTVYRIQVDYPNSNSFITLAPPNGTFLFTHDMVIEDSIGQANAPDDDWLTAENRQSIYLKRTIDADKGEARTPYFFQIPALPFSQGKERDA